MQLKTATLFALVGSVITFGTNAVYLLLSLEVVRYSKGVLAGLEGLNLVSTVSLITFFATLHRRQN